MDNRKIKKSILEGITRQIKYVPTPTSVNKTELIRDIKQWGRRMRLKEYFRDEDKTDIEQPSNSPYNKPSKWTPSSGRDQALDCY